MKKKDKRRNAESDEVAAAVPAYDAVVPEVAEIEDRIREERLKRKLEELVKVARRNQRRRRNRQTRKNPGTSQSQTVGLFPIFLYFHCFLRFFHCLALACCNVRCLYNESTLMCDFFLWQLVSHRYRLQPISVGPLVLASCSE